MKTQHNNLPVIARFLKVVVDRCNLDRIMSQYDVSNINHYEYIDDIYCVIPSSDEADLHERRLKELCEEPPLRIIEPSLKIIARQNYSRSRQLLLEHQRIDNLPSGPDKYEALTEWKKERDLYCDKLMHLPEIRVVSDN